MSKAMYIRKLARDRHGTNFELPEEAVAWRVKQSRGTRGPGKLVTVGGEPIEIPIDATAEMAGDLLEEAGVEPVGTFILRPVDKHGVRVGQRDAYLVFDPEEDDAEAPRNAAVAAASPGIPELGSIIRMCTDTLAKLAESVITRDKEREKELCGLVNHAMSCLTAENEQLIKSKVRRVIDAEPVAYEDDGEEEEPVEVAPPPNPMGELLRTLPFLAMMMRGGQGSGPPQFNIDASMLPMIMSFFGGARNGGSPGGAVDLSAIVDVLRSMGVVVNITTPAANGATPRNATPTDEEEATDGSSSAEGAA
jgi:hypothetical protein